MYEEEDFDENLIVSTKTEYDGEENVLRPKTMEGYVGQEKVKSRRIHRRRQKSRRRAGPRAFVRPAGAW